MVDSVEEDPLTVDIKGSFYGNENPLICVAVKHVHRAACNEADAMLLYFLYWGLT